MILISSSNTTYIHIYTLKKKIRVNCLTDIMTDQDHTESIACCTAVSGSDRRRTSTVPPVPVTTPRDEPRRNNIVKPEGRCNSASMTLMSSSYAKPETEMRCFTVPCVLDPFTITMIIDLGGHWLLCVPIA